MPLLSHSEITLCWAVRDSASATFPVSKYANIGVMSRQYDTNQCRKTPWEPPGYTTVLEWCWNDMETFPQRGQKRCLKRAINFSPPSTEDKHNEGAHSSPLSLMKQSIMKLSNYKKKSFRREKQSLNTEVLQNYNSELIRNKSWKKKNKEINRTSGRSRSRKTLKRIIPIIVKNLMCSYIDDGQISYKNGCMDWCVGIWMERFVGRCMNKWMEKWMEWPMMNIHR